MSSATYVYCVVQSPGEPPLSGSSGEPAGLPGTSPPRARPLDGVEAGLWVVMADAPLPEYGSEEIEQRLSDLSWVSDRAMAHEQVVEHCAAHGTVLPMKLFTLFTGEERALADLRQRRPEIERILERIAGRVEWGVRILFDEARARRAATETAAQESPAATGTGFLQRKKAEQEGVRTLAARVRAEVERAFEELAEGAAEARRREPPGEATSRLLLDAAFLVPREGSEAFEAAVQRWSDELAGRACEVTLTGPWPPYNFVGEPA